MTHTWSILPIHSQHHRAFRQESERFYDLMSCFRGRNSLPQGRYRSGAESESMSSNVKCEGWCCFHMLLEEEAILHWLLCWSSQLLRQ